MTDIRRHYLIPEYLTERRLGRHILHDERSRAFPAEAAPVVKSVRHAFHDLPLDQGEVGSCTAEALVGCGNADPNWHGVSRTQDQAYALYHEETVEERQPWPPNDPGGTGVQVCKAAKKLGWIKQYQHTFSLQHLLQALVLRPVMIGVNWYSSFDRVGAHGLLSIMPDATIRGGHEIMLNEIIAEQRMVRGVNSWGAAWGDNGCFQMSYETLERLLREEGDCTVPIF